MVPGWKGGKVLPLGGSLGEYSLNDLEEQPGTEVTTNVEKESFVYGVQIYYYIYICNIYYYI